MGGPRFQRFLLGSFCACSVLLLPARLPAQQRELSHVERFASRKARLELAEKRAVAELRKNPKDAKALEERGLARVRLGEVTAGMEDLDRATHLEPSSGDAFADLAYALWVAGRLREALDAARTALKLDPNNAAAHYYAARLILETGGKLDRAIGHLERASDLNPEDLGICFDLFMAYRRKGDVVRAGAQLRLLRQALPPDSPQVLYAQGLLAADLGYLSVAIDNFRRAVAAEPRLDPARLDLGMALVKESKWQEAADVLTPLAKDLPDSYPAAYFDALALQNTQRMTEAEAEARRAIGLNPQSGESYTLLGIILSERGAYGDAVAALGKAAQLEPKSYDAQFYLGRAQYAERNLAAARDAFAAAAALKPDDVESRFFLATTLEGLGRNDAALAEYRGLAATHPQDPRGFIGLGNLLAKHGEVDGAAEALKRAYQLDPQNFEAGLDLGRVLLRQGKLDEALRLLREAVARAPDSADAHYQLGLALRRAGRNDEAAQQFAMVDRLNRAYRKGSGGMGPPPRER